MNCNFKSETSNASTNDSQPSKMEWSEWVTPIDKKDGSIRFCADYCNVIINKLLKDSRFPILSVEEISTTTMAGRRFSTKLDIIEAYLHMLKDIKSAEIQAILNLKGDYKVHPLMFGTKVAPSIWQGYNRKTFSDIPEACVATLRFKISPSKNV